MTKVSSSLLSLLSVVFFALSPLYPLSSHSPLNLLTLHPFSLLTLPLIFIIVAPSPSLQPLLSTLSLPLLQQQRRTNMWTIYFQRKFHYAVCFVSFCLDFAAFFCSSPDRSLSFLVCFSYNFLILVIFSYFCYI